MAISKSAGYDNLPSGNLLLILTMQERLIITEIPLTLLKNQQLA
mgnify:CR=1 FL=1